MRLASCFASIRIVLAVACVTPPIAHGQVFSESQAGLPQGNPFNSSYTEDVDVGDVDLDGDFDVVFADGFSNDQNRIWIDLGGLQGGVAATYSDETAARFPVLLDDSRDMDFGDIDSDGDLDLVTSNSSETSLQGNRWWINVGGLQSGSPGYFIDQTAARWSGLGGSGSSLPPSALVGGTFVSWCHSSEFADLDDDGDLDLVLTSLGDNFLGNVPTRLFTNDGHGVFTEFNPSGFQLASNIIPNGAPALWCEGVHVHNTSDISGQRADIATQAFDVDIGDLDGDFDLDVLIGDWNFLSRSMENRWSENGASALSFRDVTGAAFVPSDVFFELHLDADFGDFDGDGDLDLYGLNWRSLFTSLEDGIYINDGMGAFAFDAVVEESKSYDEECDIFDFDADGVLDVFVAGNGGVSDLYRGLGTGEFELQPLLTSGLTTSAAAIDAEACDVDGDGDDDVFQANVSRNFLWRNSSNAGDSHAPWISLHEDVADRSATPAADVVVHAHVLDNAADHIVAFHDTQVRLAVGSFQLPEATARHSGGQVWRAELPGHLVGDVTATWTSTDGSGNTGTSTAETWTSSYAGTWFESFGAPSFDVDGLAPSFVPLSLSVPGRDLFLGVEGRPFQWVALTYAAGASSGVLVPPFGTIHLDLATAAFHSCFPLDGNGRTVLDLPIPSALIPGQSVFVQLLGVIASPPDVSWSCSPGLRLVHQ